MLSAGLFECDAEVLVGRPSDKEEILDIIEYFPSIKASGVGHSWWQQREPCRQAALSPVWH